MERLSGTSNRGRFKERPRHPAEGHPGKLKNKFQTERNTTLESVLRLGAGLKKVTKLPGISLTLRAMPRPAATAHLSNLQTFLERGFDTFAEMAKIEDAVQDFLKIIEKRESTWIKQMFE